MKSIPCVPIRCVRPARISFRRSALLAAQMALAAAALPALALGVVGGPRQISNGAGFNGFGASLSADGSRMAFYSAGNQVGGNADNSFEVYVYDRPSDAVMRITDAPGGGPAGHQTPRISGDGSRVVYQQMFPDGGFVDFQTFTRQLNTGVTTAVTQRSDFFEIADLSHDGSRILVHTGNTGFRTFDTGSATLGAPFGGNIGTFSLSGDGNRIARANFNGSVSVFDIAGNTTTQIAPAGAGLNARPDISSDGRFVAFTGNYNPLGSNADGSGELFIFDLQVNQLRQATSMAGGSVRNASISADGTRVAFSSNADPLGSNADGSEEVFILDLLEDSLVQVTDTVGAFSVETELSADGRWLAFTSNANFGGGNGDRSSEVFLLALTPQVVGALPLPGTAPLVLAAGLGCGLAMRRRRRPRQAGAVAMPTGRAGRATGG